jgi:hypothetical protein
MSNDTAPSNIAVNPYAAMAELITAYRATQLVRVAAMFSFAEHLADGPKTATELAEAESIDADATFRVLRLCASYGLVTSEDGVRFSGTTTLTTLRKDAPGSLRGLALTMGGPSHWLPWGRLPEAVRTGKPQAEAALGTDAWSYGAAHPEELQNSIDALNSASAAVSSEAVRTIDTTGVRLAVDVGGATGSLVQALMGVNSELRGVIFDLPTVVPHARAAIERAGLQDRLSAVAGDFFESVPEADLYLLRYILHDWDDESCIRILRNLRRALRAGGRVLILETVIGDIGEPPAAPSMDINMMVVLGGRERRVPEFEVLLSIAGFRLVRSTPLNVPVTIIEAVAS